MHNQNKIVLATCFVNFQKLHGQKLILSPWVAKHFPLVNAVVILSWINIPEDNGCNEVATIVSRNKP